MSISDDLKEKLLQGLDDYHEKSLAMQRFLFEGNEEKLTLEELKEKVDDDLVFNVPIYDMLDRRYAAFSSFLEAIDKKEKDPKGNGIRFLDYPSQPDLKNQLMLFYLFRLCGSGINYKESHGFGNFWVVDRIKKKREYNYWQWLEDIPESKFCDNKGYMLPQFSISLRSFMLEYSEQLVQKIKNRLIDNLRKDKITSIKEVINVGNEYLLNEGFKRQNFVLASFAADIAEYRPDLVNPWTSIPAGTNATKCAKAIFGRKVKVEQVIKDLSVRYKAPPYSVEDSRLCDPVRYFLEFQSQDHINKNNGVIYKNNSILKKILTDSEYNNFISSLKK